MADDHDHEHAGSHEHHAHDAEAVAFAIVTISSSRSLDADDSGDATVAGIEAEGHAVTTRDLVTDDEEAIREQVAGLVDDESVDAVITTGGTGLTPDDVTPEAVGQLFDREIPGFGEQFRAKSVDDVGPHGMLTRATAGIADGTPVFCLPGSEQAAAFGTEELVVPIVGHVVSLAGEGSDERDGHDHSDHDHDHGGHQ